MNNIINRVQALIAKAESSTYSAEADAFMAKAQELINDHAIDQARLKGADPTSVGHDTVAMKGTYTKERSLIWSAVANANRCQVLTLSSYRSSKVKDLTLIGREQDRQLVRLLATSLELQAVNRLDDLDPAATGGKSGHTATQLPTRLRTRGCRPASALRPHPRSRGSSRRTSTRVGSRCGRWLCRRSLRRKPVTTRSGSSRRSGLLTWSPSGSQRRCWSIAYRNESPSPAARITASKMPNGRVRRDPTA